MGKRSQADEDYLTALVACNPSRAKVQIVDARPKVNAVANQAKGLGYESSNSYPMASLSFLNIQNIHVMRDSLKKVRPHSQLSLSVSPQLLIVCSTDKAGGECRSKTRARPKPRIGTLQSTQPNGSNMYSWFWTEQLGLLVTLRMVIAPKS